MLAPVDVESIGWAPVVFATMPRPVAQSVRPPWLRSWTLSDESHARYRRQAGPAGHFRRVRWLGSIQFDRAAGIAGDGPPMARPDGEHGVRLAMVLNGPFSAD